MQAVESNGTRRGSVNVGFLAEKAKLGTAASDAGAYR
jgi:hypothetical protein